MTDADRQAAEAWAERELSAAYNPPDDDDAVAVLVRAYLAGIAAERERAKVEIDRMQEEIDKLQSDLADA